MELGWFIHQTSFGWQFGSVLEADQAVQRSFQRQPAQDSLVWSLPGHRTDYPEQNQLQVLRKEDIWCLSWGETLVRYRARVVPYESVKQPALAFGIPIHRLVRPSRPLLLLSWRRELCRQGIQRFIAVPLFGCRTYHLRNKRRSIVRTVGNSSRAGARYRYGWSTLDN